MPSHVWIPKENDWHGLNGAILTCHGIGLNFGLDIYLRKGKQIDGIALLQRINTFYIMLLDCQIEH